MTERSFRDGIDDARRTLDAAELPADVDRRVKAKLDAVANRQRRQNLRLVFGVTGAVAAAAVGVVVFVVADQADFAGPFRIVASTSDLHVQTAANGTIAERQLLVRPNDNYP